ncbi:hypothetical protein KIW84_021268 [Lathyrus oleraceus]|uniref:DUF7745 domain-containing protein n=1 Tax=Pisum sativum TaxID=3888 RepID=A0A9D4YB84_PEA|nr:hypothetical protein KIW84_021268 [Pisum sativum]
MLEEYSHIFGVEIKDQVPFISTKELPKSHLLAEALHLEKKEVKLNLNPKGRTHGFTLKFLVEKAIAFADVGNWIAFNAIFALPIHGIVLLPSMEHFVDLTSIHIFLSKNPVPTLLVDTYYNEVYEARSGQGTSEGPRAWKLLQKLQRRSKVLMESRYLIDTS